MTEEAVVQPDGSGAMGRDRTPVGAADPAAPPAPRRLGWLEPRADADLAPRWPAALAGLAAAAPTLISAAWSPSLLVDDWGFAEVARSQGLVGFLHGSDVPSRPLQAGYHGLTFVLLGDHVVAHLLLLALLNGLAGGLVWLVARRWLTTWSACVATAAWVVIPTHGATRLWIATGPIVVALVLVLLAALLASTRRPHPWLALLAVIGSGLSYEGGLAIGVLVVVIAIVRSGRTHLGRRLAIAGTALLVTAAWVWGTSPKRADGVGPDIKLDRLLPAGFGSALVPDAWRSGTTAMVPLLLLSATVLLTILPAFRRPEAARLLVAGGVVTVLGAAPFVLAGFPVSTDGMLDRANTFTALGTALLVTAVVDQARRLPAPVAASIAAAALIVLGAANLDDLRGAHDAADDGRALLAELEQTSLPTDGRPIVIGPTPNRSGWAPFGYDSIAAAWTLRTGQVLPLRDSLDDESFARATGHRYRWVDGHLAAEP